MKHELTISYGNNCLHLCPPDTEGHGSCITMDDSRLDDCFATLVQRHDVLVQNKRGLKNFIRYCRQHYIYIKAAGGVVSSPEGQQLMIFREGFWDLPKGKVEQGETLAEAALREVREETGVEQLKLGQLIAKTYHIYDKYGGWHLKQTSWYTMHTPALQPLTPQTEEGISQAVWASPAELQQRLSQSFPSLRIVASCLNHKTKTP